MPTRTLEIDLRQGTGAESEPMYGVVTVQRAKAKTTGGFEILPFETSLKLINGKATITEAETDGTGPFYDSVYLFRVQNGYCGHRYGFMAALPDGTTPITTGELPMVDPITGEGIYMDVQEWNERFGDLPNKVESLEGRVETLEDVAGLTPESPIDAQTANLIENSASLTANALNAAIDQSIDVQTAHLATATESLTEYSVASGPIPFLYGAPIFTTETVGSTPTIAGGTYIERTNANLRYEGLNVGDTGSHYYFQALTGSGTGSNPWRVSFDFDGGEFEMRAFRASSNYGGYRVWIDGNPSTPTMPGLTNSGNSMVKLTLPSTQRRRITLEFDRGFNFAGFWIPAGASVTPSSTPNPKRLAVVGDSYVWGAGIAATSQNAMGFPQSLGRLMGWPQVANFGVGGSGYVVTGSGGGKYGDPARMDALTTFAPDIVLITGSQNDRLNTDAQIQTEAESLFTAIKTALPSAQIIATSMLFAAEPTYLGGGFTIERRDSMDAAIKAAAITAGVDFIDASAWFNGTGRLGEPVGDGNADLFRSAIDWNHPSQDGHDFIARRLAPEIRRLTGA